MHARVQRRLLLAVLVCSLAGCATLFEPTVSPEEQQAYAAAETALESGPEAGRAAFERFLARFPDSALAPDATLELAHLSRAEGDVGEAARRYAELARGGGPASDRARVQLATLDLERGDHASARRWLERARLARLEGADLRNAYRALAETAARPAERVRWLAMLRTQVSEIEVAAIDVEIDGVLAELPVAELEAAARLVGDRPPVGHVYVALAERAFHGGNVELAQDALDRARRTPISVRYAQRLAAVEVRLRGVQSGMDGDRLLTFEQAMARAQPDASSARGAIGVVLPLTGRFAGFGEEALRGVLLAADTFHDVDGAPHPQIRIVVRDGAGDPERAAAAVRELAQDPEVVAIIGPLVSAACEAAAREAQALAIPLLALTSREDITSQRSWVFRVQTRPAEEAQVLAERAIALGARRFAILYPDDPYGIGLRGLFWDAIEARGGRVVAVTSFDPKATDFADPIRRLVGYTMLDAEEKSLLATRDAMLERARRLPNQEARELRARARSLTTRDGRPIPPIVDFDALFIPASHDDMVLIAPQLAFHEVTGARLLGTESWNDEELVRLGGNPLEGALFAAHFYPDSPVPYVRSFRERFEATFGAVPDAFSAHGYDAARLVLLQLARGRDARDEVRDGIASTVSFPGVSGILSIRADGNAQKRPFLLGIEKGRVVHYTD